MDAIAQAFQEAAGPGPNPSPSPTPGPGTPQAQPQAQPQLQPQPYSPSPLPTVTQQQVQTIQQQVLQQQVLQQQQQQPRDGLLALVHFLLAAQKASPPTPEGLRQALGSTAVPVTLDDAAAVMGTVMELAPGKLHAVLGPADGAVTQDTPRALFQSLLSKAGADNNVAVTRVSLQAILYRWMEKTLALDPRSQALLASTSKQLDAVHNFTTGPASSAPSKASAPTPTPTPSTGTTTKVLIAVVVVLGALSLALVIYTFIRHRAAKNKGLTSGSSDRVPLASGGRRFGNLYQQSAPGSGPAPAALRHASLQHAPLQHAPLQHAPLQHAPLQHAPLQHAPLQHAPLQHAPLQHAPLQHAPAAHLHHQPTFAPL